MKRAKSAAKKLQVAQQKLKGLAKKVKSVENAVTHPGRSLGGAIGAKLGSRSIGSKIGGFVGRIVGTGDYAVASNSLLQRSATLTGEVPTFTDMGRGTRVVHREYLGDVVASATTGAFSVTTYAVNPGLSDTFPWLAPFANQFDQWRPNGIVACFKSLSSFYSGTSSLGTVVLASDYDVLDASYGTKVEMENAQFSVSGSSAASLLHPIECKSSERASPLYYTRSGAVASTDNKRFFDLCNLQVATAGCTASQVVGELWITYDITLYKPQLYGGVMGRSLLYARYNLTSAATGADFFSAAAAATGNSATGFTLATRTITFPEKYAGAIWRVKFLVVGGAATTVYPAGTLAGGMSLVQEDLVSYPAGNAAASQQTYYFEVCYQQIASPGVASTVAYATATSTGWPSAPTIALLDIEQVNPSFTSAA